MASGSFGWSSSPPLLALVSSSPWACGRACHRGSAGSPDRLARAESLFDPLSPCAGCLHSANAAHPPETGHMRPLSQLFHSSLSVIYKYISVASTILRNISSNSPSKGYVTPFYFYVSFALFYWQKNCIEMYKNPSPRTKALILIAGICLKFPSSHVKVCKNTLL